MYTKFSKSNDLKKFKFVTVDIVHNIWGYDDVSNLSIMTIFQVSATVGIAQNRYSTIIILLKLLDIKE